MRLREALITQSPSLTLQRAAADEIAALDAILIKQAGEIERLTTSCATMAKLVADEENPNET